jgi:4-diphosphocytidyl-2C-methyl-D-erythritol kinase
VTPLRGLIGRPPGVVLVTPPLPLVTADVFAAFDAGSRPADQGASRATSTHLASELAAGLSAARLLDRAAVLAAANDLVPAAAALMPALTALRRALARLLARPIGQSGSGPTLWALYPSEDAAGAAAAEVRTAIADGRLAIPGEGPPTVVATTIAATLPARPPADEPARSTEEP